VVLEQDGGGLVSLTLTPDGMERKPDALWRTAFGLEFEKLKATFRWMRAVVIATVRSATQPL
jgi:hypothetical protein